MSYKSVSLIVTDAETDRTVILAAAAFCARHGAHLDITCLGVDPTRYEALPAGAMALALDVGSADAQERADALAVWVQDTLPSGTERHSIRALVVTQLGMGASLSRIARYADIIFTGQPYGPDRLQAHSLIVEAALFGTSAPVMIVPDGKEDADAAAGTPVRPLVAWNESDEALVAIRRAIPLLAMAPRVDVVMIDPKPHSSERSDPGGAVSLMLARHGVKAEVSILAKSLPAVSEVIQRFAKEHGNDLIVMGAYGHSRFREALFGGATRDMLDQPNQPLLMAH